MTKEELRKAAIDLVTCKNAVTKRRFILYAVNYVGENPEYLDLFGYHANYIETEPIVIQTWASFGVGSEFYDYEQKVYVILRWPE